MIRVRNRFYVASLFSRRREAAELARLLRECGKIVTSTWHEGGGDTNDRAAAAAKDCSEVLLSDALVVLAQPYYGLFKGGGHCTEFGIALGHADRILPIVVGDRSNVFYNHPVAAHFETVPDFIAAVGQARL